MTGGVRCSACLNQEWFLNGVLERVDNFLFNLVLNKERRACTGIHVGHRSSTTITPG